MSIIYKTTNLINEKIYVGKHEISANDGYLGTGKLIKYAIKKYGKKNFIRETLEYCTSSNVNEREIYWINFLSATNSNIGYNLTSGGEGGHVWIGEHPSKGKTGILAPWFGKHHTEESKQKISKNHMGIGHPLSEYNKKKLKEINKGKIITDEQKRKQSEKMSGENHPMWGKKHPIETINKMKNSAQKGYKSPSNKFKFILSNQKDYWTYFSKNERNNINGKFREKKTNIIIFKGIIITRVLKNENKNSI
jgi:group I intron endonuclease